MREYFKEQLENTKPMTEESIAALKQNRIDNGVSTESLEGIVPGDKFLFVLVEYDKGLNEDGERNINLNVEKLLEREIEEFEEAHEFLEMASDTAIPRFKPKEKEE